LKFSCKNCGQKITAADLNSGKKGKCPKCKTTVVIPEINEDISLKLQDNGNSEYAQHSEELHLKRDTLPEQRFEGLSADGLNVSKEDFPPPEVKEKPPKRSLPWVLDIFLYPASASGLINIGIFWLLSVLFGTMNRFLFIPIIFDIGGAVVAGYMYYFLIECIRDSAAGGIRAPENMFRTPDIDDVIAQVSEMVACFVIFWVPLSAYLMYKILWPSNGANYNPINDFVFWILAGYGIFFFPIGLLAIVMFDSSSAYNPLLWITSIFSTLFQYCGLVLFFCGLGWLVLNAVSSFQQSLLFSYLFGAAFVYMAMVAAHLIGRFYYLNSKKLNWEV
jgi:hypothetical protein